MRLTARLIGGLLVLAWSLSFTNLIPAPPTEIAYFEKVNLEAQVKKKESGVTTSPGPAGREGDGDLGRTKLRVWTIWVGKLVILVLGVVMGFLCMAARRVWLWIAFALSLTYFAGWSLGHVLSPLGLAQSAGLLLRSLSGSTGLLNPAVGIVHQLVNPTLHLLVLIVVPLYLLRGNRSAAQA